MARVSRIGSFCSEELLIQFAIDPGTLIVVEWANVQVAGNEKFDTPPLRFAKAFTTLGVALALANIFQVRP